MTQQLKGFTRYRSYYTMATLMKKTRLTVFIAVLALAVSGVQISAAATYYVATGGNDGNPGTSSQPFRTVAKGLSRLSAGDTLLIRGGTYGESINSNLMRIPTGTSWSTAVTIAGFPGDTVVLRPASGGEVINLAHSYIQYVLFDNLVIDAVSSHEGISMTNGAHHVRFQNSEIKNSSWNGILVSPTGTDSNQFVNLKVHNNGLSGSGHGIYINTNNNLVEKCEIYNNRRYGLQIYNGFAGQRADNNVIRSNKLYGNQEGAITINAGSGNFVYNNLVWGNFKGIDVMWRNPVDTKIYNNAIYANSPGAGIEVGAGSVGALVKNNIVFQNGAAILNSGSGSQISNNLAGDPRFGNVSAADFSLQSGSPAIDAGATLSEVANDFNGATRPQGAAYDIGAYEFGASTAAPAAQPPAAPTNLTVTAQ